MKDLKKAICSSMAGVDGVGIVRGRGNVVHCYQRAQIAYFHHLDLHRKLLDSGQHWSTNEGSEKGDVIPLWGLVGVSTIVARKRVGKEGGDSE